MPVRCLVKQGQYYDSVVLMEVARWITGLAGVTDAAVLMATEANKGILRDAGLLVPDVEAATTNDLVVVVEAESVKVALAAIESAENLLRQRQPVAETARTSVRPRTLRGAVRSNPGSNLAVISVAGRYAANEAWEALYSGVHVLLFSDNVSVEDEIGLKSYAAGRGLLLMGPGCGTAIINGVALGFANVVPRGPIGIVAASGTGVQEVVTLLAKRGVGISQAIGTGGRDLQDEVGGIMAVEAIRALQADPETRVLVLISKPPSPAVAAKVLDSAEQSGLPAIVCFLGAEPVSVVSSGAIHAHTLQEAAYLAAAQVEGRGTRSVREEIERDSAALRAQAIELRRGLKPGQRHLRGLYSGGTLASEALVVWGDMLVDVRSNVPLDGGLALADATRSEGNCAIDLGADEFTVGRPHPMIDNDLRIRRLTHEAAEPSVGVIVLDVVLGYGAHPDPASELGPAIRSARADAAAEGRGLVVVTSVTGTREDPQNLHRQIEALEDAGAVVCECNAAAARLAGYVVGH